jgi:dihydrofolate reductase
MSLSLLVAMSRNRVIGRGNRLPWHLPSDLRRFKRLTMGHTIVMGRKTYESIGRPLPGRRMVVLTRQPDFAAPDGVVVAHALREALGRNEDEIFIVGGADLFAQTLPLARKLYLTLVEAEIEGDTYFPEWDGSQWTLVAETQPEPDGATVPYVFRDYVRIET